MSHKLDDITLYYSSEGELEKKFTMKQNVVSDLYIQFLNGYKPAKTSRITVRLTEQDNINGYFGSILGVDVEFDKDKYWILSNKKQNQVILDTVHHVAILCADKYGWDKSIFKEAYSKVLEADFKYIFESKKKTSKDRKHKATVEIKKDETCTTISVVFYDKSGNKIKTIELLKSFQHIMFYGGIIKKHKWFNNEEFGLYTNNEELIISASLNKNESKSIIIEESKNKEELEGLLRRITYQKIDSKKDIVEWMNK
tara:strand:+ start:60 stop:824 length:765 start_codon:yes stop_codon:yes gene_type:complete